MAKKKIGLGKAFEGTSSSLSSLFNNNPKEVDSDYLNDNGIVNIDIKTLEQHHNHTFKVLDDDDMENLILSVKESGIIMPLIVRNIDDDKYEIIAGHRRCHAAKKAGLKEVPCIVMDIDDDTSDIYMVDSNYQRENILPSERAFSYKVKLDAIKRITLSKTGKKSYRDLLAEDSGVSSTQIARYLKLTSLKKDLLDMVDAKIIPLNAGVSLAYLLPETQENLVKALDDNTKIDLKKANLLKSKEGSTPLTENDILEILKSKKKNNPLTLKESSIYNDMPEDVKSMAKDKRLSFYKAVLKKYASVAMDDKELLDSLN